MEELASLTKRVAYLEREVRRIPYTIDGVEERTENRMQKIEVHLEKQDENILALEKRLDAKFADINANLAEIRNMLATLIAREK